MGKFHKYELSKASLSDFIVITTMRKLNDIHV